MMEIETWMWVIWLAVFVISLVIEAVTSELVSVWFTGGSLVSLIISFIPDVSFWVELIVFFVVSVALLLSLRPLVNRFLKRETIRSNIDEMTHKKGLVIDDISPFHLGEVRIGDVIWSAMSSDEADKIEKGKIVEVLSVNGNKLIVHEIKKDSKE